MLLLSGRVMMGGSSTCQAPSQLLSLLSTLHPTISLLIPLERIAALDLEYQRPGDTLPGEVSK